MQKVIIRWILEYIVKNFKPEQAKETLMVILRWVDEKFAKLADGTKEGPFAEVDDAISEKFHESVEAIGKALGH